MILTEYGGDHTITFISIGAESGVRKESRRAGEMESESFDTGYWVQGTGPRVKRQFAEKACQNLHNP
jgi:hypothetical protein